MPKRKPTKLPAMPKSFGQFRPMKNPAFEGELRAKSWGLPLYDKSFETSQLWQDRARDYWERQERVYGLVMSDFTIAVGNFPETGPVITTFSTVLKVLPGERLASLARTQ